MMSLGELRAHLKDREEQLFRAETRHSLKALEGLLSPEFREIGRSGRLYTYSDIIEALLKETPDGIAQAEDFEMQMLAAAVALVTYRSVRHTENTGEIETRRSSIWRLEEDGTWRMVFHQGTSI